MNQIIIKKRVVQSLILILGLASYIEYGVAACEDSFEEYKQRAVHRQIEREREYRAIVEKWAQDIPLTKKEQQILMRGLPTDNHPSISQKRYEQRMENMSAGRRNFHDNRRRFERETTPIERELFENFREVDTDLFPDDLPDY